MKRIRRPRSEYESLLARKDAEGLTYKQLATQTGVPESTLVLWLRRIKKERSTNPVFVEVETEVEPPRQCGVEIVLASGHRVTVEPGFDEHTLRRVLSAVGC